MARQHHFRAIETRDDVAHGSKDVLGISCLGHEVFEFPAVDGIVAASEMNEPGCPIALADRQRQVDSPLLTMRTELHVLQSGRTGYPQPEQVRRLDGAASPFAAGVS